MEIKMNTITFKKFNAIVEDVVETLEKYDLRPDDAYNIVVATQYAIQYSYKIRKRDVENR